MSLTRNEKRIRDALMALGSPREVLPVAYLLGAYQARDDGQTAAAFMARVAAMAAAVWGEAADPKEIAAEIIREALKLAPEASHG